LLPAEQGVGWKYPANGPPGQPRELAYPAIKIRPMLGARVPNDLEHLDQVPQRACQPIRGPYGNHVEVATDGGLQCVELCPLAPLMPWSS
jgi:hypothetical protein